MQKNTLENSVLLMQIITTKFRERIIVHICWQCLFEHRLRVFEQCQYLNAIACSNIGMFKHWHYSYGFSYGRCLNVPMFECRRLNATTLPVQTSAFKHRQLMLHLRSPRLVFFRWSKWHEYVRLYAPPNFSAKQRKLLLFSRFHINSETSVGGGVNSGNI